MKITYTVPKTTYEDVMAYVDEAQDFFMANDCNEFQWEAMPNEHGYTVKVLIDAKEDINPY